jgi:hypothetical protein
MGCRREVFKDFSPGRIFSCTTSVALVNYYKVKKVRRELLIDVFFFFGSGYCLVKGEIDFI